MKRKTYKPSFLELFLSCLTYTEMNNFKFSSGKTQTWHSLDRLCMLTKYNKVGEKSVVIEAISKWKIKLSLLWLIDNDSRCMMELLCLYCCQMLYHSTVECLTIPLGKIPCQVWFLDLSWQKWNTCQYVVRVGATPMASSGAEVMFLRAEVRQLSY